MTHAPRLGFAEAIERLDAMPEFLEAAVDAVAPEEATARPGADEFSLVEHACHLRDLEREGYLARVRRILVESEPALAGFDGTAVALARDYLGQDARAAAREFAAVRHEVCVLLAGLAPAQLERTATFGGERITLADLAAMMVEHDREHREEIERLMDFIEE